MYSTAKGAVMMLDRDSSGEKSSGNRTEEEKNASGKGLLDSDGCGLLLGLMCRMSVSIALDYNARRHDLITSISALLCCGGAIVESV
jgi:hypothetical protein